MEQLFTLAGVALGSSGLSAIVVAILNHHWAKKKNSSGKLDALVEAQKVLMIDRVRYLGSSYIHDGEIALEDKENLAEMYQAYKALGETDIYLPLWRRWNGSPWQKRGERDEREVESLVESGGNPCNQDHGRNRHCHDWGGSGAFCGGMADGSVSHHTVRHTVLAG